MKIHTIAKKPFGLLIFIIIICVCVFSAGCITGDSENIQLEDVYTDELAAAHQFAEMVSETHVRFLSDAKIMQKEISEKLSKGDPVPRESLHILYNGYPTVSTVFFVNESGYITDTVPSGLDDYLGRFVPGIDSSSEAKIIASQLFPRTAEGSLPISAEVVPIFLDDGTYAGSVLAIVDLSVQMTAIREAFPGQDHWTFWIINNDGYFANAPRDSLIGTNAYDIESPNHAGVITAFDRVLETKSGVELINAYSFSQHKLSDFAIAWDTVDITPESGEKMRVVIVAELTGRDPYAEPAVSTDKSLVEFVHSAYLYALEHGKEQALAEFNNPNGQFTTKEFFIVAFNKSLVLAHPFSPETVGTSAMFIDSNGVRAGDLLYRRAQQGGGYVVSLHTNPAANMQEQIKFHYVQPIDDDWYIISGTYEERSGTLDAEVRNHLVQYLRSVSSFAESVSREEALSVLNDPNGPYFPVNLRFFAMDFNGTIIADPQFPQFVGNNYMAMTDMYGSSITRDAVLLAKSGGGFQYEFVPKEMMYGILELRLEYVLPINNEWLVLASVKIE